MGKPVTVCSESKSRLAVAEGTRVTFPCLQTQAWLTQINVFMSFRWLSQDPLMLV